jgi:hypothetical protein
MASIAQDLLVALIVAGCAVFSAWRLMSPRLRLRALDLLAPGATRLGAGNAVARVRNQTIGQLAAGCSACSHNKTVVHHPGGGAGRG